MSHFFSDYPLAVNPAAYFITGGKYVVTYLFKERDFGSIGPGEVVLETEVRLPRGTEGGDYELHLLSGSEVLLEDGTLIAPTFEPDGSRIRVEDEVATGWAGDVPPLRFDVAPRRLLGEVAFRLADIEGRIPPEGDSLFEGLPSEEFTVLVQMRSDLPLKTIDVDLRWPLGALECDGASSIFENPETGELYTSLNAEADASLPCFNGTLNPVGQLQARFGMEGGTSGSRNNLFPERPLEYFKPLGEWVDVIELRFRIPDDAPTGTVVPLQFLEEDPGSRDRRQVSFLPYGPQFPCDRSGVEDNRPFNWDYNVSFRSGTVRVVGERQDPEPRPDAGIHLSLGDVSGRPGDLVEVPVFASTREPLLKLVLAFELDSEIMEVESIDYWVRSVVTGEAVLVELERGEGDLFRECDDPGARPPNCWGGVPYLATFYETGDRFILLEFLIQPGPFEYPGTQQNEIVRLRLRIREDAPRGITTIRPSRVSRVVDGIAVEGESGGLLLDSDLFAPASAVRAPTITILGDGAAFARGDANADESIDISDALATLGYLFLGSDKPACLDAADADDSGHIQLTDAVFLLGNLFLGEGPIPAPSPECGADSTEDALDCSRGCGKA